ncbi:MAG: sulfate adenylyltransferase [Chloroflexota bacterium]|nr:MAG: sulfate adenylyltransferase [Chloroflexota bacterium]
MAGHQSPVALIAPHGGVLVDRLRVEGDEAEALRERAAAAVPVVLSEVARSDLEMIATGVLSPLEGFMTHDEYEAVLSTMHLPNGLPWTLPVTLPVSEETAARLRPGQDVALVDAHGELLGLLELVESYRYDRVREARSAYGTDDGAHPGVARLMRQDEFYLAGPVWMLVTPSSPFPDLYLTPRETRALFQERGWRRIVAFQTRNPIHRAHEYLLKCALEIADGLLLHPLVGETRDEDLPAALRVESYRVLLQHYFPVQRTLLSVFPAAMRYAGPREAIWHAIARKNYGCTHFIVGRDHAGVGGYYGPYDAQRLFDEFDPALIGITPLMFEHAFYCCACGQVTTSKTCPHDSSEWLQLSGTEVRARLRAGEMLPAEFTRPEVSAVLMRGLKNGQ